MNGEILRVAQKGVTGSERQKADWHIDIKNPPPVVLIRYPPTECRARDGGQQGRQAEQGHCCALLFRRESVEQYPLTTGLQTASCEPLDYAEQDELGEAVGHAAQSRTDGEYADRQEEVIATTEMSNQPTSDRQDNGVGGEVACKDPFSVVDCS